MPRPALSRSSPTEAQSAEAQRRIAERAAASRRCLEPGACRRHAVPAAGQPRLGRGRRRRPSPRRRGRRPVPHRVPLPERSEGADRRAAARAVHEAAVGLPGQEGRRAGARRRRRQAAARSSTTRTRRTRRSVCAASGRCGPARTSCVSSSPRSPRRMRDATPTARTSGSWRPWSPPSRRPCYFAEAGPRLRHQDGRRHGRGALIGAARRPRSSQRPTSPRSARTTSPSTRSRPTGCSARSPAFQDPWHPGGPPPHPRGRRRRRRARQAGRDLRRSRRRPAARRRARRSRRDQPLDGADGARRRAAVPAALHPRPGPSLAGAALAAIARPNARDAVRAGRPSNRARLTSAQNRRRHAHDNGVSARRRRAQQARGSTSSASARSCPA